MLVLIMYEFMDHGLPRYNYTVTEHESVESALEVFKHQNPQLKPMCAREIPNGLQGTLYL